MQLIIKQLDNPIDLHIHFDIEQLKGRLRNNQTAISQILALIKSNLEQPTAKMIDEMKSFVEIGNIDGLRLVAHKLKGTAQSSCFSRLAELSKTIQNLADSDKALLIKAIEDIVAEVEFLKKHLSQYTLV